MIRRCAFAVWLAVLLCAVAGVAPRSQIFVTAPLAYTGLVGTRGNTHDATYSSGNATTYANSQMVFFTTQTVCSLQFTLQNFTVPSGGETETGTGAALTITAGLNYPVGTFTQIKFGGMTSTTLSDLSVVDTDVVTPASCVTAGTDARLRLFLTTTSKIPYQTKYCTPRDQMEGSTAGTPTLTDKTLGGAFTGPAVNGMVAPMAIKAMTKLPSIVIWGDSIEWGAGAGQGFDSFCNIGPASQALGASFAYTKFATSGGSANQAVAQGSALRKTALAYISHSVNAFGVNDYVGGGGTLSNMLSNVQTIAGWSASAFLGTSAAQTFQSTITDRTTSTDFWTTVVNQTLASSGPQQTTKVNFNNTIRGGVPYLNGYFEIADKVESARDSGFWGCYTSQTCVSPNNNAISADGIHPNAQGQANMKAGYNTSSIHYP